MDRTLVIYDLTGRILSITYGATETPQGVPFVWCDIPPGAIVDHVDVSTGQVVFQYEPESDLGRMQRNIEAMQDVVNNANALANSAAIDASDAVSTARLAVENATNANTLADSNNAGLISLRETVDTNASIAASNAEAASEDITVIQNALAEVYELLIDVMEV